MKAPRVATSVTLTEYDAHDREIYAETCTRRRVTDRAVTTYADDPHGN